jgi:hypothetical protein
MDEKEQEEQKEHNEHIDLVSAILTSAYIVNTTKDIEDLTESLKIFREFRGKYFDRLREWGDMKEEKTGNLIAALLTAGYIVNTASKEETVNETIDLLAKFRDGYLKLLKMKPEHMKDREDINLLAGIITAGLIVNTTTWEEIPLENLIIVSECKKELLKLV